MMMSDHPPTPPRLWVEDGTAALMWLADEAGIEIDGHPVNGPDIPEFLRTHGLRPVTPADILAVLTSMGAEIAESIGVTFEDVPEGHDGLILAVESRGWSGPGKFVVIRKDALEGSDHVHRWVDARNQYVESGEWCPDCNAVRAEDALEGSE